MKSKWESINEKAEIASDKNEIPNDTEKDLLKQLTFYNTIIIMAIITLSVILSIKVSWYFVFLIWIGVPLTFLFSTIVVSLVSIACSLEKEEIKRKHNKENEEEVN